MTRMSHVLSEPAPVARDASVPIVALVGSVVATAIFIFMLNSPPGGATADAEPEAAPAPAGEAPAEAPAQAPVVVGLGTVGTRVTVGESEIALGPHAFPPGSTISLSFLMPADTPAAVVVAAARLGADGALVAAEERTIDLIPDADRRATVGLATDALVAELGAGLYRVDLSVDGQPVASRDLVLGAWQPTAVSIFETQRVFDVAAGSYTGVAIDASGAVTSSTPATLAEASLARAGAFGIIDGRPHLYVVSGIWAGSWLPVSDGVTLRPAS